MGVARDDKIGPRGRCQRNYVVVSRVRCYSGNVVWICTQLGLGSE